MIGAIGCVLVCYTADIINWKQDKDQLQAMDRKTYNLSSEEKRI